MVQRNAKSNNEEPEQKRFELPSEIEHLFQVVDVDEEMDGDPDVVFVKIEVSGGPEEGRTTLIRLSLDDSWKGFFATRLFLKAISEPYKGEDFPIDTDNWIGRQLRATIVHNKSKDGSKTYANIDEYNFDGIVKQEGVPTPYDPSCENPNTQKAWDEDMRP